MVDQICKYLKMPEIVIVKNPKQICKDTCVYRSPVVVVGDVPSATNYGLCIQLQSRKFPEVRRGIRVIVKTLEDARFAELSENTVTKISSGSDSATTIMHLRLDFEVSDTHQVSSITKVW